MLRHSVSICISRLLLCVLVCVLLGPVSAAGGAQVAPARGRQPLRRPSVVGRPQAEAATMLARLGLSVVSRDTMVARVPEGVVVRQSPAALTAARRGDVDTLFAARPPAFAAQTVRVPEVVEQSLRDGAARLRTAGLQSRGATMSSDDSGRARISAQKPPAGTRVLPGATVVLALVIDERMHVPSVIGLDSALAARRVIGAGFALSPQVLTFDELRAAGTVAHQDPPAGSAARRGTPVTLQVSRGARASGARLSVPLVLHLNVDDARAAIAKAGLVTGHVDADTVDGGDGRVMHQQPHGGADARAGDAVNITVAVRRTAATVPTLTGLTRIQASVSLAGAGLVLGGAQLVSGTDAADGAVFHQSVAAGTTVAVGTAIDVAISVAPVTAGGPPPGPPRTGERLIAVPAVEDSSVEGALRVLREAGFTALKVDSSRATSPEVLWFVRNQAPGAGEVTFANAPIHLTAYAIPRMRAPYLLNLSEAAARHEAAGEGFAMRVEQHVRAFRVSGVRVQSQTPAPFVLVAPATEVAVVMSDPLPPLVTAAAGLVMIALAGVGGRRVLRIQPRIVARVTAGAPEARPVVGTDTIKTDLTISAELGSVLTEIFDGDRQLVARDILVETSSTRG